MDFDADEFMRGYEWAKWSDCREMVEDAYQAGFNAANKVRNNADSSTHPTCHSHQTCPGTPVPAHQTLPR